MQQSIGTSEGVLQWGTRLARLESLGARSGRGLESSARYVFICIDFGLPTERQVSVSVKRRSKMPPTADRKSTRLNSSHVAISYAVFCLKKKKKFAVRANKRRKSTRAHQC